MIGSDRETLLRGESAASARQAVDAIAGALGELEPESASLETVVGVALFFSYRYQESEEDGDLETAQRAVDELVRRSTVRVPGWSLLGGQLLIPFVLQHLVGDALAEHGDPLAAIDRRVTNAVRDGEVDSPELVAGLAGVGVYALERGPSQGSSDCLAALVERMSRLASWRADRALFEASRASGAHGVDETAGSRGTGWLGPGMAHGAGGAVAFLGYLERLERSTPESTKLLRGLVAEVIEPGATAGRTPGWCSGELGIATALAAAADGLGDTELERRAVRLAHRTCSAPPEAVTDPCLCHGACGVAFLLHRLALRTGDPDLVTGARTWYRRTLSLIADEPDRGVVRTPDASGVKRPSAGLLDGSAGVGLALLAATTVVSPDWDRLLLASTIA